VRYAARQLRRNKSLSIATILCFALGIGADTPIFRVVDAVLLRPLPFPDTDRVVLVGEALPNFGGENVGLISSPEYLDYKRLMAFAVVQRTREIGIRLAIGATPGDVLRLVVGQGARVAAAGVVIGLAGALVLTRAMRTLLFDVSPLDPLAFVTAALLLLGVATLASYLPARRAARIDPQAAIRAD
jgi:hypothetical protein